MTLVLPQHTESSLRLGLDKPGGNTLPGQHSSCFEARGPESCTGRQTVPEKSQHRKKKNKGRKQRECSRDQEWSGVDSRKGWARHSVCMRACWTPLLMMSAAAGALKDRTELFICLSNTFTCRHKITFFFSLFFSSFMLGTTHVALFPLQG